MGEELSIWYKEPADPNKWEEAIPLGNGRLGAIIFGGLDQDLMILNEDTLWSGWPEPNNDRQGSYEALVKIRKLLKEKGDLKQNIVLQPGDVVEIRVEGIGTLRNRVVVDSHE